MTRAHKRIIIVGGGAAGLMAAASAGELCAAHPEAGVEVLLVEQNHRMGKKLRITGKGRCNVTNDCDREEFLSHVLTNPRFLYSAISHFDTGDTKAFFESLGVPLKTERGKRVFPVSDRADDIADALCRVVRENGVSFLKGRVSAIQTEPLYETADHGEVNPSVTGVSVTDYMEKHGSPHPESHPETVSGHHPEAGQNPRTYPAQAVILCTGGCSYPVTGSDGNGLDLAKALGHTIVPPRPSLVPLVCDGTLCGSMMGLSLRNVRLQVWDTKKHRCLFDELGEMLFTHYGVTGPLVLSASACMPDLESGRFELHINLKPALDEVQLDRRIQADFRKYANRDFINALDDLLPQKAIEPVATLSGIDFRRKVHEITKEERHALAEVLRCLKLHPIRTRPMAEAIVTKGGVSVRDVNPKTMESKRTHGLYFAGEVLDTDALTGGFNLQIAFSTARLAALSAFSALSEEKDT